jgi:protein-tyrosine-phosphatase
MAAALRPGATQPPRFFELVGHPLRWQLLRELVRSDRRVRELVDLVDRPQSLVSYHLRQLRAAGAVFARRSSHDGRDAYYGIDLGRCGELLAEAGGALHPRFASRSEATALERLRPRTRILFLCTGNSSRSQIAEALLRHLSGGRIEAFSAGSNPKAVHPNAIRVLRERGLDVSHLDAKHFRTLGRRRFDYVISLCDRVREICPEFPGAGEPLHWSIPDPAAEPGSDGETIAAFERTAAELEVRIGFFLHRIADPTSDRELTRAGLPHC